MKKNFGEFIKTTIKFFTQDIWTAESEQVSNVKKRIVMILKGGYLVINGFIKDQCFIRASALTYTFVLSIVPLLAVAFSVLKGFGFQNNAMIQKFLYDITAGREEIADNFLNFLNNTNVGALGAIGVGFLLFSVITLLGNIEKSFNVIWGVQKSRTLGRKFTDYLSVTIISPLLFIVAISATATVQSNGFIHRLLEISVFADIYIFLLKFVPYIIVCLVLTFIYGFMPNTKVKFTSALTGGIIAGVLWQFAQWGYIKFQIGAAKYNAIYGVFAQIPLFLVWDIFKLDYYFTWYRNSICCTKFPHLFKGSSCFKIKH